MMESSDTAGSSQIELPDVHYQNGHNTYNITDTQKIMASSMDIEQSVPTVAELRGKSDQEDRAPSHERMHRGKLFWAMLALPFLAIGLIVSVTVFVVRNNIGSSASSSISGTSLKDMSHDDSFAAVVEYLGDHDISPYPELIREGSYQNQAAKWMAHEDDGHRLIPEGAPSTKEGYTFMQRYIMVLMYYQMGGETWKYDLNFLSEKDTCEWFAWVMGTSGSYPMGARCNENHLVTALIMVGVDIKGRFPDEISKLTSMTIIEMDVNEITGSVPESFKTLQNLQNFHLSHNKLTGSLPNFLAQFPDLETVDVSFNFMEGNLPTGLATMDKLRGIALDHNLFSGDIGFWGKWSGPTVNYKQDKLEYIFLEQNALTGSLEKDMIEKFPNLKVFDASDNDLQGTIPNEFFQISSLNVLDLHDNAFTGPIPGGIPVNVALQFLALQKNQLTGTIMETIGNLQVLKHLDLSSNKISDYDTNTISNKGISSLNALTYLFLSENDFEAAPFPFWIQNMTNLEELSLKSLKMDGTIPTWIGDLTELVLFDIDDNDLRGSIPSEVGKLSKLEFLLMNRNELTDDIPSELGSLSSLRKCLIGMFFAVLLLCRRAQVVLLAHLLTKCFAFLSTFRLAVLGQERSGRKFERHLRTTRNSFFSHIGCRLWRRQRGSRMSMLPAVLRGLPRMSR